MREIYQLKIVLQGISPMIWRRLLVRNDMPLETLHQAIQLTLNWEDDFMYAFKIHGKDLSTKNPNSNNADTFSLQDFGT